MRKTACLAGIFAAGTGILAGTAPAFADSADNDGINIGNDNNLSVLPIQLCGNNIAVLGAVVPILSPQANDCVNAPIVDHPTVPEQPKPHTPTPEPCPPGVPGGPGGNGSPGVRNPGGPGGGLGCDPGGSTPRPIERVPTAKPLPTAPTPVAVRGHHAVTG
ncbi:hypothetical protein [Saccharopolyspora elongata]|uniref:Uncharacterized protein n=1 Tax=Saccharopolyspora elongata TaxID=2530387 RepID=A0A4V6PE46_9PSEU|nr:hypothetical protein [Saccharopolyspora elongata]TDD56607.1 hypothetical protein E1288_00515 [Saccharopolyspora elongata]